MCVCFSPRDNSHRGAGVHAAARVPVSDEVRALQASSSSGEARSREHGAGSTEQGARSREHGVGSTEHGAGSTGPSPLGWSGVERPCPGRQDAQAPDASPPGTEVPWPRWRLLHTQRLRGRAWMRLKGEASRTPGWPPAVPASRCRLRNLRGAPGVPAPPGAERHDGRELTASVPPAGHRLLPRRRQDGVLDTRF